MGEESYRLGINVMERIIRDENGNIEFDFSKAEDFFEPHELASIYSQYLSDVDFVLEEANRILFVEYKNANVKNASNPEAFNEKLKTHEFREKLARKYYGTLFLLWACSMNRSEKPIQYILLIEKNPAIDGVMRKKLIHKMKNLLPFQYVNRKEIKRSVIEDFKIIDLFEWQFTYPDYPFKLTI